MPAGESLETPFGAVRLARFPRQPGATLRAWDAADRLLLEAAALYPIAPARVLLVNDNHGALAVPLAGAAVWTDSRLSELAIADNLARNGRGGGPVVPMTERPPADRDLVLMRVPKQLSLFRYQLQCLRETLPGGTPVLCAGMDKHLPRSTAQCLEQWLGQTERHRGRYKARWFTSRIDVTLKTREPLERSFDCPPLGQPLVALPGVFGGDSVDAGSTLLLAHWDRHAHGRHVVDLGCGCGVLGLVAAAAQPQCLAFVDESAMAVACARRNLSRLFPEPPCESHFLHADGLRDYPLGAPDLVLLNPPFHDQHVVGEFVGRRLVQQAGAALARGGELWLVANRQLRYRGTLARCFSRVEQVAEDRRFRVWRAIA